MKPKAILAKLREKGVKVRNKTQISNLLVQLRNEIGPSKISLGELEDWCNANSNVPVDEDQGYVVRYYIHYDEDEDDEDALFLDEDAEPDTLETNKFRYFIFIGVKSRHLTFY